MPEWLVRLLLLLLFLFFRREFICFVWLRSKCCVLDCVTLFVKPASCGGLRRREWRCVVVEIAVLRHVVVCLVQRRSWLCFVLIRLIESQLLCRQSFHLLQVIRSHHRFLRDPLRGAFLLFLLLLCGSVRVVVLDLELKKLLQSISWHDTSALVGHVHFNKVLYKIVDSIVSFMVVEFLIQIFEAEL